MVNFSAPIAISTHVVIHKSIVTTISLNKCHYSAGQTDEPVNILRAVG